MMTILVTGASGFLATNLISELLAQNHKVIGLTRNPENCPLSPNTNLVLIKGSIADRKIIENAIEDCDAVIHTAAETRQNLARYETYHFTNVICTANLLHLAIQFKVKKFIYVSTVNTIGYGDQLTPGTENKAIKSPFTHSNYVKSKIHAEALILAQRDKIAVIIVHPSFMLGKYSSKSPSFRLFKYGLNKSIIFYPSGGRNFVHVLDVSRGIVIALSKGENGEKYILSGENLSYKDFYSTLCAKTGHKALMFRLPNPLLYFVGLFGNIKLMFHFNTNISLINLRILCLHTYYSNLKAKSIFGIKFSPVDLAIEEALSGFDSIQIRGS